MYRWTKVLASISCGALVTAGPAHDDGLEPSETIAAEMSQAAAALEAVVPRHIAGIPITLRYGLDAPHRTVADFFPRSLTERHGAQLGMLSLSGRRATHQLLRTALSEEGYALVNQVMSLEEVLQNIDPYAALRVPDDYGIHLFGSPVSDGTWAWKFEGHHLSLNFTLSDGAVRSTPVFIGVNPVEVRNGPRTGLRTFTVPLERAHALVNGLDADQRIAAVASELPPSEIVPRGGALTVADAPGLASADMTSVQRRELHDLVASFARILRPELAQAELDRIDAAGWEQVRFRWRGRTDANARQYFRIDGPTVIIEFDRVSEPTAGGDPNHVHAIWHDPERDYGRDLLAEHYDQHHGR